MSEEEDLTSLVLLQEEGGAFLYRLLVKSQDDRNRVPPVKQSGVYFSEKCTHLICYGMSWETENIGKSKQKPIISIRPLSFLALFFFNLLFDLSKTLGH